MPTTYARCRAIATHSGVLRGYAYSNDGASGSGTTTFIQDVGTVFGDGVYHTYGVWPYSDTQQSLLFNKVWMATPGPATMHEIYETAPTAGGPWTTLLERDAVPGIGVGNWPQFWVPLVPADTSGVCVYGTEQKDPSVSVLDLGATFIANLISKGDWRWAAAMVAGLLGRHIYLAHLCASPPPPDEDWTPTDFIPSGLITPSQEFSRKAAIKLTRVLWDEYCQCKAAPAGQPAPVGPGTTNINQPTWYITNTTNNISNYDIANTLNFYLTLNTTNQYEQSQQLAAASFPSRCAPDEWDEGTIHEGLIGSGEWELGDVVGFKIEVTERDSSQLQLLGNPMYLWNMGWITIKRDDALIEEKRVTREGYYWFPCALPAADRFAYALRDYTVLRVTELVKPAAIVIMGGP